MNVKDAVAQAKAYIADLFADEGVEQIGLEEVKFQESQGVWLVTIGFTRPLVDSGNALARFVGQNRTFKTVAISDKTGDALSVTDRRLIEAQ